MPIRYAIDPEESLVRVTVTDPLDLDQIAETVQQLLSDAEIRPGMNVLSDHSSLRFTATTDPVSAMAPFLTLLGKRLGPFRCAVVVAGDASYGMARMAEVFAEGGPAEVHAFRSLEEAEAWLV